ncbi:PD-(D/E)XK nuclease family protein [Planctomyces sp. SH-PL14]|uniref:PD-(D/E)XK nuclease family protein n=1 Tax=Planctomyces sp. SH-PL14 TaxID=1632864 RepID=UPI00078DD63B|nr:PD-(D/E)XK nuclease family protein [Planctomyces sp. SH-PL14]AMV21845.1 AAA-like domain protein [Planctomyces sp. SH-PL14]
MPFVPPFHFSVSQIRSAATCPRIFYFDSEYNRLHRPQSPRVTRTWTVGGDESTAAGGLFHNSIERFNWLGRRKPELLELIERYDSRDGLLQEVMRLFHHEALNRTQLHSKSAEVIQNFTRCVRLYFQEFVDIVHYGRSVGRTPQETVQQLFADLSKRLDVTFHVGPRQSPVHVTGRLDYIFFDWRSDALRILDYKLMPDTHPNHDLFQVVTYSLMHHHQHSTRCGAGVLYLHPKRVLHELSWDQVYEQRHKVYDLLASMAEWRRYGENPDTGLKPRGEPSVCQGCKWNRHGYCEKTLGPKEEGSFVTWSKTALQSDELAVDKGPSVSLDEPEPPSLEEPDEVDVAAELEEAAQRTSRPGKDKTSSRPPDASRSLHLGRVKGAGGAVELPVRNLSTHTAVVGAAGSGKTWFAKILAEEAILSGVPVLAIDPQGDLVQFLKQRPIESVPAEQRERYREYVRRVEPRIFTPGTSHATRLCLSPIRLPSLQDLEHERPDRRQEEYDGMIHAVAMDLVSLVGSTPRGFDQQQAFLAKVLRGLVAKGNATEIQLTDIAAAAYSPDSIGVDDADLLMTKANRETLGRQLYALASGPMSRLFTGGQPLDLDVLLAPSSPGRVPLNVIYLNTLNDQEKPAFVAALATEVYRWMTCRGGSSENPQLLFYLDEARDFLPAGTAQPPAKRPVTRLFTQGRKYGVGCLVCTQSPRSVDYNIFGNCSTKLIGRLETSQDSERVSEWFSNQGPRPPWIGARTGAEKGTFVGRWPDQPDSLDGAVFETRTLFSVHEGAWTADRIEKELQQAAPPPA